MGDHDCAAAADDAIQRLSLQLVGAEGFEPRSQEPPERAWLRRRRGRDRAPM